MKAMVLNGPEHAVRAGAAARSGRRPRRGGGPGHHLRRRPDHPARQGRAAEGAVSRASSAMRSPARSSRPGRACAGSRPATPVTTYFYLNCGHCRWCLPNLEPLCENSGGQVGLDCDGAYAEYVKLPAQNFIKLPDGLDHKKHPAEIGVVTDALATPYKVLRRARVQGRRNGRGDRRRRRTRHPSVDDGEMGADAGDRGRHQAGQV